MDQPEVNETDTPLDRCPVCRYSLRGLPAAHRCPECGFEYDEHTRVWRSGFSAPLRGVAGIASVLIMVNGVMQLASPYNGGAAKSLMAMLMLAYLGLLCLIWRSRPLIAVTPKGILTRWGWRTQLSEWPRIQRIGEYEANVFFKNFDYGPVEYARFLPNKTVHAEFRRTVNQGKARYDPPADHSSRST